MYSVVDYAYEISTYIFIDTDIAQSTEYTVPN